MSASASDQPPDVLFSLADEGENENSTKGHVASDPAGSGDSTGALHGTSVGDTGNVWADEPAAPHSSSPSPVPSTRFGLGLKSTLSSREAHFDADPDDLDADDVRALPPAPSSSSLAPAIAAESATADPISIASSAFTPEASALPPTDRSSSQERDSSSRPRTPLSHRGTSATHHSTTSAIDIPLLFNEGLARVQEQMPVPDWVRRGAGTFDGTVNMANSILGAGIVGLPYSMRESGFVAGIVLLVGLSFLTDWTIRLIVLNAKLSGRRTYIEIMQHCFGPRGSAAVSLFQFAFAFGGMCAFCVVIGDTIPAVLGAVSHAAAEGAWWGSRWFVITFCTLAISFPLSLYRNIESLSKASAIALVSMVVIIASVIVRGPMMPSELKGDPSLRFTIVYPTKLIRSIAVISFAFVCHHNSLLIYGSLKEPSMDKFGKVTHYSTLIAGVAATTMSIAGYWSFEEKTLANILNNFPADDKLVNLARFLFGVNMFTTFPLECFVCREVLEMYFWPDETAALQASAEAGEEGPEGEQYNRRRHYILTSSLVISSLIIALLTCDLGIVLELTGGLSATALAYIFPSACFLKLSRDAGSQSRTNGRDAAAGASGGTYVARTRAGGYHSMPADEEPERAEELQASTSPRTSRELADLESTHGPAQHAEDEVGIEVDPNEVELPLKPGAPFRRHGSLDENLSLPMTIASGDERPRSNEASGVPTHSTPNTNPESGARPWSSAPAGIGSGGVQVLGTSVARPRKTWTHTILMAVATACFGLVVLGVSVVTALSDLFTGRTGERHTC